MALVGETRSLHLTCLLPAGCCALLFALVFASPGGAQNAVLSEFDCVIMPQVVVDVSSAAPGLLEEVLTDRSETVEEGQVLARLEAGVEAAAVAYARARAGMQSDVQLEEISSAFDQRKQKRVEELYQQSAISLTVKDEAETSATLAKWRLRQAREQRRLRELDLRRAEAALERRTVRSPSDGVVLQRFKQAGEYVENEPILRIAQLDPLRVEAIVPMSLFGHVQAGMQAEVLIEADQDGPKSGIVNAVDPMADPASGTFGVRLELANPEHRIAAGQKCRVRFIAGSGPSPAVAAAPAEASDAVPASASPLPGPLGESLARARNWVTTGDGP